MDFLSLAAPDAPAQRVALLVYHANDIQAVALEREKPIVVGRGQDADLALADSSMSRQHARFELAIDHTGHEVVTVEDIGSTNGTWFGGARIQRAQTLGAGESVLIGTTVVTVYERVGAPEAVRVIESHEPPQLIAFSPAMREVERISQRVGTSRLPVLIIGETGTGKDIVARVIHDASGRRVPMRVVDCGAVPDNLVDSVLFGDDTADPPARGVFEEAHGGTVFIAEVTDLHARAQLGLLELLETGTITRVGAEDPISIDVRVVAGTYRDLEALCEHGSFRWDLYYRLHGVEVRLPPLRQRPEDIDPLVTRLLAICNDRYERRVQGVDPEAQSVLREYHWPGNVEELREVIEDAVADCHAPFIGLEDLPDKLRHGTPITAHAPAAEPARGRYATLIHEEIATNSGNAKDLRAIVREFERVLLRSALLRCGGNQSEAAALLRMPRRTLVHKVRELGLHRETATDLTAPLTIDFATDQSYKEQVEQYEKRLLVDALTREGSLADAARALQISEAALGRRVRKYNLR